jgi:hypothetical protein
MLEHNETQLDFIIEMYAIDNPKELAVTRHGQARGVQAELNADAAWSDALIGDARQKWLEDHGLAPPADFWTKVKNRLTGGS